MGYSTSILQNPVCACDKKKDRWRSKSRVVPSPGLAPGQWVESMSATSRGAQQLLCVRCPDEVKSSNLGSASRNVIPNCEAEEITQKMMVLFCFVFSADEAPEHWSLWGILASVCRPGSEELPGRALPRGASAPWVSPGIPGEMGVGLQREAGAFWAALPHALCTLLCCPVIFIHLSLAGLKFSVVARWCALFLPEFLVSRTFKLSFLG